MRSFRIRRVCCEGINSHLPPVCGFEGGWGWGGVGLRGGNAFPLGCLLHLSGLCRRHRKPFQVVFFVCVCVYSTCMQLREKERGRTRRDGGGGLCA